MGRKRGRKGSGISTSSNLQTFGLTKKEIDLVRKARELLIPIKEKYRISGIELSSFFEEEPLFPASIIGKRLTVLESVVKYLKEEKNFSYKRIADTIGRDERNVWNIFHAARRKFPAQLKIADTKFWIPFSAIADEKLSALESAVFFLKKTFLLSYHEIAVLLSRNDRTIWTVYRRALRKKHK